MSKLRIALTGLFVGVALASFADEIDDYISPLTGKPYPKDSKITFEEFKARDERVMKKTGGFVYRKAEGPLAMFVDARNKATLTIDEVGRVYNLATHLEFTLVKQPRGETNPLGFAQKLMAEQKPLLVAMVVNGGDAMPALCVYPEERIGLVNADKLKGGEDPSAPEMRVNKEMWRAIGFVLGLGYSPQPNDVMQPLYSLAELDANNYPFIQPMNMAKMSAMGNVFGVKKQRKLPYFIAVREGWADSPTNDYQRAIWAEYNSEKEKGPVKAIAIPPPTKK